MREGTSESEKIEMWKRECRTRALDALRTAGAPGWHETAVLVLVDHLASAEGQSVPLNKTGWSALVLRLALDEAEAREVTLRERIEDLARDNLALRLRLERREERKAGIEADMVQP